MIEGQEAFVALSWSPNPSPTSQKDADEKLWQTSEFWRQWITVGKFPDHPWRSYLQQSALALKGLTYAPTGALMAASTTSLVIDSRRAIAAPTTRGSRAVIPPPGRIPTRAWVSANTARSEATRKSQPKSISRPPVNTAPLTAPTIGVRIKAVWRMQLWV